MLSMRVSVQGELLSTRFPPRNFGRGFRVSAASRNTCYTRCASQQYAVTTGGRQHSVALESALLPPKVSVG